MTEKTKRVKNSLTIMSEIVLPNDANSLGKLRGGRLLDWMDIAGEITAQRHAEREAVTASMTDVVFKKSINLGDIVTLEAKITRAFESSMEIMVQVWSEHKNRSEKIKTNEAIFTFVAIDEKGHLCKVPKVKPIGVEEVALYNKAGERRDQYKASQNKP